MDAAADLEENRAQLKNFQVKDRAFLGDRVVLCRSGVLDSGYRQHEDYQGHIK